MLTPEVLFTSMSSQTVICERCRHVQITGLQSKSRESSPTLNEYYFFTSCHHRSSLSLSLFLFLSTTFHDIAVFCGNFVDLEVPVGNVVRLETSVTMTWEHCFHSPGKRLTTMYELY